MLAIPLFPPEASTMAARVDHLYFFLVAVSAFFVVLIASLVVFFSIRYRRRASDETGRRVVPSLALELTWTIIPLCLGLVMFAWGARLYFTESKPPGETIDIYVVGKQWMWKFEHMDGRREINQLHIPVGHAIRLTGTSEDVIHSFFVPAFRIKADVIPGRYRTIWFNATKVGRYHLFCSQYCGTRHSEMRGEVIVMTPEDYQAWLAGGASDVPMASQGQKTFQDLSCATCHRPDGQGRGPSLVGVYGSTVPLDNGQTVVADAAYIRESILSPTAKIVAGYQPIMPTFQGLVSEEQLLTLIEYIKSLKTPAPKTPGSAAAPAQAPTPKK